MHQLQTVFSDIIKTGLERSSATTPSKWATLYRFLPTKTGNTEKNWNFDGFPWLKAMHDSKATINIGKKAAQMGFTETVLNLTFFRLDILGQDCLYVLPTAKPAASNFSSSRVDAAVAMSPHLTSLFSNIKNSQHKKAGNADLFIRGCRSRTDLKSDPISFLVFDELDEMDPALVTLGELRCTGQEDYQIWKISTPTIPDKKIDFEYKHSTQEHFMFKCPACGKTTELIFPDCLEIIGDNHRDPECNKSFYKCKECKKRLEHLDKPNYLGKGFWEPFGDKSSEARGFHVNQMYSFIRTPGDIAKAWLEGQIKPSAEQEFYNSRLGLPFVAEGSRVESVVLSDYASGPQKGLVTMGVDVGRHQHHVVIRHWEVDRFGPDVNMMAKSKVLLIKTVKTFDELEKLMYEYQVLMAVFDSSPEYLKSLEFSVKFAPNVKLCNYTTNRSTKIVLNIPDPFVAVITANRTLWIETALSKIINKTLLLPRDTPQEFEDHLRNIFKLYGEDSNGNEISYYDSNGADHFAHALTYSEIALPLLAASKTNEDIEAFL